MSSAWAQAFTMVLDPYNIVVMLIASLFGLFVGAVPGLTATMATALLVPVTFFMAPIPAIAAIVTATAMAIFSGDIPGCLMRMPGTPASAAYTDEAYAMTRKGQAELALGAGLVFSAIGGLFGTAVLILAAPALAEFALKFSSFEYFWLVLMGLTCAVFMTSDRPLKGFVSLLLGLFVACVGLGNPAGYPRFTFGNVELMGGIGMIPMMIGMFAISEIIRFAVDTNPPLRIVDKPIGNVFKGMWGLARKYPLQILRGSALGTLVGALPGAGADIAAWMSYAISKKMSKEPEKFGTGHVEGIVESGSANNSALAGAWIPALVFGIPGDSITAIVIGVLYMKNMNPGPSLFTNNPQNVYAVYLLFIIANLIMIPLGWWCIKVSKQILKVPRTVLMPVIMLFCVVGSFAINNTAFDVTVMLVAGIVAYVLEDNGFPIAPAILGVVLGGMLEENFITSMIKSDGNLLAFVARPVAATLCGLTLAVWFLPLLLRRAPRPPRGPAPPPAPRPGPAPWRRRSAASRSPSGSCRSCCGGCGVSPAPDPRPRRVAVRRPGRAGGRGALPPFAALRYNFKDLRPLPGFTAGVGLRPAESETGMRGKLVVGNWKMNGGLAANAALLSELVVAWKATPGRGIAVCVPYPYLAQVAAALANSAIGWGAQDVSEHAAGAYTGEVSAAMLAEFGCRYAIVGHSERRQYYGDTDAVVAAKAVAALAKGLTPIACVGETLAEHDAGVTESVVLRQIDAVLAAVGADAARLVVAYEPVWAIGTGRTASSAEAQAVHAVLRSRLARAGAAEVSLLYGGSVKPDNATALFAMADIDGGLIGGASLKAGEFLAIARA